MTIVIFEKLSHSSSHGLNVIIINTLHRVVFVSLLCRFTKISKFFLVDPSFLRFGILIYNATPQFFVLMNFANVDFEKNNLKHFNNNNKLPIYLLPEI